MDGVFSFRRRVAMANRRQFSAVSEGSANDILLLKCLTSIGFLGYHRPEVIGRLQGSIWSNGWRLIVSTAKSDG